MKEIIKVIKKSKSIAIFGHISPDPDCMGSMSALSLALNQMGKQTKTFVDTNKTADYYTLFDFDDSFNADINVREFDLLLCVDVAAKRMLGKYYEAFSKFPNTICIDHHHSRDLEANMVYNQPQSASCSEIIFNLVKQLKVKITPQMASYLFAGVVGDTNCFEHDNVTPSTHLVASELYALGADTKHIIFEQKKHQSLEDITLRKLLYSNMTIKNKVAYMIFTNKITDEAGTDNTKPYVTELLNVANNKFAFVINQKEKNTYTVSIRCKEGYNACEIAQKYGGGGHIQAAGLSFVGAPVKHAKMIYNDCIKQIKDREHVW